MPGTCGSIVAAIPLPFLPHAVYPWALAGGALLATLLSALLARRLPPKGQGGDPGWFVLDEAAGMWVAAFAFERPSATLLLVSLVLFRIFDMAKPWPLRRLEGVGGGFGIVLDDLGAGVYALALARLAVELGLGT